MLPRRYIVSVDLGEKQDWTAITTIDTDRNKYKVVGLERMRGDSCDALNVFDRPGLSFYDKLLRMLAWRVLNEGSPIFRNALLVMDGTGPGREVVSIALRGRMATDRVPMYPVQIRPDAQDGPQAKSGWIYTSRKTLLGVLATVMEQGRLDAVSTLKLWPQLEREARMARVKESAADVSHRMSEHDDLVLSLAQGLWIGERLSKQGTAGGIAPTRWG
jgi:hypothetical protein